MNSRCQNKFPNLTSRQQELGSCSVDIPESSVLPCRFSQSFSSSPNLSGLPRTGLLINARSLSNKIHFFRSYVAHYRPLFIGITETWASNDIPDAVYSVDGYTLYRRDRIAQRGGGVMLYISNLACSCLCDVLMSNNPTESVWGLVNLRKNVQLLIGVVYRSPNLTVEQNRELFRHLQFACTFSNCFKIIVGDFNFPSIDWQNFRYPPEVDDFMEIVLRNGLSQHVDGATREQACLDLIFASHPDLVNNVDIIEPLFNSDHCMVLAELMISIFDHNGHKRQRRCFAYRQGDWDLFSNLLHAVNWTDCFKSASIDDVWKSFSQAFLSCVESSVPYRKSKSHCRPLWETPEVRRARAYRHKVERDYSTYRTDDLRILRNKAANMQKAAIRRAVRSFELRLVENSDPKPFWNYVKSSLRIKPQIGPLTDPSTKNLVNNPSVCAQILSDSYATLFTRETTERLTYPTSCAVSELLTVHFTPVMVSRVLSRVKQFSSPGPDNISFFVLKKGGDLISKILSRIFQQCMDTQQTPLQWRTARICPIFKKGNRKDPQNYRPISLTCSSCKVMESCVRDAIWSFWSDNNLIGDSQFGFMPQSSCTALLLEFLEDVTSFVDRGQWADAVYIDFAKAFNSVPHKSLLLKLSALGIRGDLLGWIESFLMNRSEIVYVDGQPSRPMQMVSGVPQGSVLGPILFIAYVNDLDDAVHSSRILKYADDAKIYIEVKRNQPNVATALLQSDLKSISDWASTWQLPLNISKCVALHFGYGNPKHTYSLDSQVVARAVCEKDLGVHVTEDLKFSLHVAKCVRKAESVLAAINRTIVSRDSKVYLKLYKQLVRPCLEYATPVWNPHYVRDVQLLENVQRRATRRIGNLNDLSYADRLTSLGLLSLEKRRKIADLVEVYKIVHQKTALKFDHFFDLSNSKTRGHSLKFSKKFFRLDCRKFFFSQRVIDVWNNLPGHVTSCSSVSLFKRSIIDFI